MTLDQSKPTVTVCRGCCCGTTAKHPDVDHEAHLATLRALTGDLADFRTSDCLGPCERSNVVVITPSRSGHRSGGRPTWLGYVNDDGAAARIEGWLRDGGPGLAPLPGALRRHRFLRVRKRRSTR